MEDQSERLKEYQSLLSDLRSTEKEAYDGKVKAEQEAAVAEARLESERVMSSELNKHLDKLRSQIHTSSDKHEKELTELRLQAKSDADARAKELADSNNKLVTALNQVAVIERELANIKAENQQLKAEIAELKKAPKTRAVRAAKDEKKES